MGQGYSTTALSNGAASVDVSELPDVSYEKSLCAARFMKTVRGRHSDGLVVVKIFVKPAQVLFPLGKYDKQLQRERELISDISNALAFSEIVETDRAVYLMRQYLYSNLYDRISTRPFLEDIEKRWIVFQLLCGLRDCHAKGIRHGDIKSENILVTSWNWVYLADFASFKPAYLPEDNPADFSFYFDTSGRRTCYLAPERFRNPATYGEGDVTEAMDIFSLGCVIAEIFLEGSAVFNLSTLFKYRRGDFNPAFTTLGKIEDLEIKSLILHMINPNPEQRLAARDYLSLWRRKVFPEYFYSFLHQYVALLTDPTSGQAQMSFEQKNLGECDDRIDRIYHDIDKISFFLGYDHKATCGIDLPSTDPKTQPTTTRLSFLHQDSQIPNNFEHPIQQREQQRHGDDGTLVFLSVVTSSMRNTARSRSRSRACDLLLAFGERVSDNSRLDRCLPYLVEATDDPVPVVRISALNALLLLLRQVEYVPPANASIFQDYILPKLVQFSQTISQNNAFVNTGLVRSAYASYFASLAESALKFLDIARSLRIDRHSVTDFHTTPESIHPEPAYPSFDSAKNDLIIHFESQATALLTDTDSAVRRAFLPSVQRLCVTFGKARANDVLLSHLNTYLNDKDWMLKSAFFETIVGIAIFIGGNSLEEYILPLMFQALSDPEEFVVFKVLWSLASMAQVGLFQRPRLWEINRIVAKLILHPNTWIQTAVRCFLRASLFWMDSADAYCIIFPIVQPLLKSPDYGTDLNAMFDNNAKTPIQRYTFETAMNWAVKAESSKFWAAVSSQKTSFNSPEEPSPLLKKVSNAAVASKAISRANRSEEDEVWWNKIASTGAKDDEEGKISLLRDYIWRAAHVKAKANGSNQTQLNSIIPLQSLKVTPQTVFFDEQQDTIPNAYQEAAVDGLPPAFLSQPPRHTQPLGIRPTKPGEPLNTANRQRPSVVEGQNSGLRAEQPPDHPLIPDPILRTATSPYYPRTLNNIFNGNTKASIAIIQTDRSNAAGTVTAPVNASPPSPDRPGFPSSRSGVSQLSGHSYDGGDPHVLEHLHSLYIENYPSDIAEFGPAIPTLLTRPMFKGSGKSALPWRPEGCIVAQFSEHTAAVNRIAVAPDHSFFITGSDDGTIKVWDAARLERNFSARARQTYRNEGSARVLTLCFLENTHCFASCNSDGSIQIIKVEVSTVSGSNRYSKLKVVRQYQLPQMEYGIWCDHYKSDVHSLLVFATNRSRVLGIDLRTMRQVFELNVPSKYGGVTCFCVDRKKSWLLVGTSDGNLVLWDLRFFLQLKAWSLFESRPIYSLSIHPSRGRGRWVCVAGGSEFGEVTVWDIEKMQCREIYRTADETTTVHNYGTPRADDKLKGSLEELTAKALQLEADGSIDRGIRALTVGADMIEDNNESRGVSAFMFTSGPDRKVRFWDLGKGESSLVCSGLDLDEPKPIFTSSRPSISLTLVTEGVQKGNVSSRNVGDTSKRNKTSYRTSRTSLVSLQQQQLLRSHLDCVNDIAVLEHPFRMIISVDRLGTVLIYR